MPQHHYEEDVVPQQLHSAVGAEQAAHAHQLHHCHDSAVDVWLKPEEVNRRNLGKFMELSFLVGRSGMSLRGRITLQGQLADVVRTRYTPC